MGAHPQIERAGLLDYRTYTFKPALQVDLSHHVFEHIEVSNNDYDGMGVLYSDIYFPDKVNYIINSTFKANKRHGISFRCEVFTKHKKRHGKLQGVL